MHYFINIYATEGSATDATVHHSHAEAAYEFDGYRTTWLTTMKMDGAAPTKTYTEFEMELVLKEVLAEDETEKRHNASLAAE